MQGIANSVAKIAVPGPFDVRRLGISGFFEILRRRPAELSRLSLAFEAGRLFFFATGEIRKLQATKPPIGSLKTQAESATLLNAAMPSPQFNGVFYSDARIFNPI